MKTTIPKLRRIIRQVIIESWDPNVQDTWGIGAQVAQRKSQTSRKPTLPETLEAIEIIKAHGGNFSTSVYEAGEEWSDQHREVLIGRAGDAVFNVTVTPNSFSAQIHEGEKDWEKAELPGQKGRVNPNDYFAQGQHFDCRSVEEFEAHMEEAMKAYAVPMRSRGRRSGARKAGYEHFRNK